MFWSCNIHEAHNHELHSHDEHIHEDSEYEIKTAIVSDIIGEENMEDFLSNLEYPLEMYDGIEYDGVLYIFDSTSSAQVPCTNGDGQHRWKYGMFTKTCQTCGLFIPLRNVYR